MIISTDMHLLTYLIVMLMHINIMCIFVYEHVCEYGF